MGKAGRGRISGPNKQPLPKMIGGFEIREKLGQGAMGAVFKAYQPSLDREVALKILPNSIAKDTQFIERFKREARTSGKLDHPNIVIGIDVGKDEPTGLWYFAMEFVDGPTLGTLLNEKRLLPEAEALKIVREIAEALACAEKNNIVHRDIKPDNILIPTRGQAKLADLGLAKDTDRNKKDASLTQAGSAVGTPHYMAPEQIRGQMDQIDTRTDLYALGATLFHMVTGRPPYEGESGAVIMSKHLSENPPAAHRVNPSVSKACGRLITRMMSKHMDQRPKSAQALIEELDHLREFGSTTGPHAPVAKGTTGPRKAIGRGTTGPRVPVVGSRTENARSLQGTGTQKGSTAPLLAGCVAALVLVVAGAFLFGRSNPTAEKRTSKSTPSTKSNKTSLPLEQNVSEPASTASKDRDNGKVAERSLSEKVEPKKDGTDSNSTVAIGAPEILPAPSNVSVAQAKEETALLQKFQALLGKARDEVDQGRLDQGLTLLTEWSEPVPESQKRTFDELKRKIQEAISVRAEEAASAAKREWNEQLKRFDQALLEGGDVAAARKIAEEVHKRPGWKGLGAAPGSLKGVLAAYEEIQQIERKAMEALKGKDTELETKRGKRAKGKIQRITPEAVYLRTQMGAGWADLPVKFKDLSDAQIKKLRSTWKAKSDDQKLALGLERLSAKDVAGAAPFLKEAGRHSLAEHYQSVLAELAAAAPPIEAEAGTESFPTGEASAPGKSGKDRFAAKVQPGGKGKHADLNGILLCDYRYLKDGRVEMQFDWEKPFHQMDLIDRSLAAWFQEVEIDLNIANDSRWSRVFYLGDAVLTHAQRGGQVIEYMNKTKKKKLNIPTGGSAKPHGPSATRRYRIKGDRRGLFFQVDDAEPMVVPLPWQGGRFKWPSHETVLPPKLKVTGRLDPRWVKEMADVAKDRMRLGGGGFVPLALKQRTFARPEIAPWMICWSNGFYRETRLIAGWNEFGAAWGLQGEEIISPKPQGKGRTVWSSALWPAALVYPEADLHFEAKIVSGTLYLALPRNNPSRATFITFGKGSVGLEPSYLFNSRQGSRQQGNKNRVPGKEKEAPIELGKWQQYQILCGRDSVTVAVNGHLVYKSPLKPENGQLAFWAFEDSAYRIRKISIRRFSKMKK